MQRSGSGPVPGIDISHYQGSIAWPKVAGAGYAFAYIKCTEGVGHDDHFTRNRAGAKAAGLHAGAYHFFHYTLDWAEQSHTFTTAIGSLQSGELPPVLDLEDRAGIAAIGNTDGTRKVLAWLHAVQERLGLLPIIYADRDFIATHLTDKRFAAYPLWLAAYTPVCPTPPAPFTKVTFWQHSERGSVPGIVSNGTDLDYFMGDKPGLISLCKA